MKAQQQLAREQQEEIFGKDTYKYQSIDSENNPTSDKYEDSVKLPEYA